MATWRHAARDATLQAVNSASTTVRGPADGTPWTDQLSSYLALVRSFFLKDVRVRYAGSLMGFFWTVVHPLLELMTYTFVFTVIIGVSFHEASTHPHRSLLKVAQTTRTPILTPP